MIKKVIYSSSSRLEYSLNSVGRKGLRENGIEVFEFSVKDRGIWGPVDLIFFYWRNSKNIDAIIIGYDSPALVIFLRPFCRKKIIYNAFRSMHDGLITSRKLASPFSAKAIYHWLLDFMAVHLADLTVVESDNQAKYFKKLFKVSRKKIFRNWIGVDESMFFYDPTIPKANVFTVLFRGSLMPEAGVEYIIRAAKILEKENIKFVMQAGGQLLERTEKMISELKPANLDFKHDFMPINELRNLMQKCHLSIGQLSDHERLERTIPHKVYESLIMRLPYLTAANRGILELLKEGETCITCEPANAESLAQRILWARDNPQELERIAGNGYSLYQKELKSNILAKNLLDRMGQLY